MWLSPPQWDVAPRRKASEPIRVKTKSYRDAQAGANQAASAPKKEIQVVRPQPVETASPAKEPIKKQESKNTAAVAEPKQSGNHYYAQKIYSIDRGTTHMDFLSKLQKADRQDFAMIHGRGGSKYSANSTIAIRITDTSAGIGKSTKVQYSLDVRRVSALKSVFDAALAGLPIGSLYGEKKPGDIYWTYRAEKNNSYKLDEKTNLVPVTKIEMNFRPFFVSDEGTVANNYPWYVKIENFKAPARKQENGQISHVTSEACYKNSMSMNISLWELCEAFDAVSRFIQLWDHRSASLVDEMCTKIENDQEKYRQATTSAKD